MRSQCVKVPRKEASIALAELRKVGVLKKNLKPKVIGDYILIPVTEVPPNFSLGEECVDDFEETLRGKTYRDLLEKFVPETILIQLPRSYDIIGEIAVIQLPDEALTYGGLIANAIMKVNKNVKSVYAAGPVEGRYRLRPLKHLGGSPNTVTIHKEYGIKVYVDINKAYFNPALSEEHRRIAEEVVDSEIVLDLFTGVGPFALHIAALRRALVVAIDANPEAIKCLIKSLELNRKKIKGRVVPIIGDAFHVLKILAPDRFDRVIMNLPLKAVEFLPDAMTKVKVGGVIYVYTVGSNEDEAVKSVLDTINNGEVLNITKVLDYAPKKFVFRVKVRRIH